MNHPKNVLPPISPLFLNHVPIGCLGYISTKSGVRRCGQPVAEGENYCEAHKPRHKPDRGAEDERR